MKKIISLCMLAFICHLLVFAKPAFAVNNPLSVPNNKFGIHILFPSELSDAAKLVNSSGGDWGYVTIPIQAGDKDLKKWQAFMDQARQFHLIPIIRLATEGDYFNTASWRKPAFSDVLDFANFLNSLTWPTENKYIVVFNEVNRADEWGGNADPTEYANILSYAVTAFKSRNPNFFILSAGLDNAAINSGNTYNEYTFLQDMNIAIPGIFNQIDGITSHSYPNPGFSSSPSSQTLESIDSFAFEKNTVESMASKNLPVFITETGWSTDQIAPQTAAAYFQQAFSSVWNDPSVVAVTPFLLRAGGGPFTQFSFLDQSGKPSAMYTTISAIAKTKGQPLLTQSVLAAATYIERPLPVKDFSDNPMHNIAFALSKGAKNALKWFLRW